MSLPRLVIKIFASWEGDDAAFIPVFHRWIREVRFDAAPPIDVADYRHVPDGPTIQLIGHRFDIVVDRSEGPVGLAVVWKRELPESAPTAAIATVLDTVLAVAEAAQAEPELAGLRCDPARLRVIANDRLGWPNDADRAAELCSGIEAALAQRYGADAIQLHRVDEDPRCRLAIDVLAPTAPV